VLVVLSFKGGRVEEVNVTVELYHWLKGQYDKVTKAGREQPSKTTVM
jgi:hypothetical protein